MGWNIFKKIKRALTGLVNPREAWQITTDSLRDLQDDPGAYASAYAALWGGAGTGDFWSALGSGAKEALPYAVPAATNYLNQQQAAAASAQQAREQMQFQERMSNTAYQRQVSDLMAAGLNPSYGMGSGGASSPGGAMGDVKVTDVAGAGLKGVALKFQRMMMDTQLKNLESQTQGNLSSAKAADELAFKTHQEGVNAKTSGELLTAQVNEMRERAGLTKAQAGAATSAAGASDAAAALSRKRAELEEINRKLADLNLTITERKNWKYLLSKPVADRGIEWYNRMIEKGLDWLEAAGKSSAKAVEHKPGYIAPSQFSQPRRQSARGPY